MQTTINAKPAEWPPEVWAKWERCRSEEGAPKGEVVGANYFTPRPYAHEYDRGHPNEGFVYVIGREVFQVIINREEPCQRQHGNLTSTVTGEEAG